MLLKLENVRVNTSESLPPMFLHPLEVGQNEQNFVNYSGDIKIIIDN